MVKKQILVSLLAFRFPHCRSAFYRIAGWEIGVVICRMTAVTWFVASTNQRHSAFSIPHFTFCILPTAFPAYSVEAPWVHCYALILLVTVVELGRSEIISHFRPGTGPVWVRCGSVRSGVSRCGPVRLIVTPDFQEL